jgi:hypothetical protein
MLLGRELTYQVTCLVIEVHRLNGPGILESVCESRDHFADWHLIRTERLRGPSCSPCLQAASLPHTLLRRTALLLSPNRATNLGLPGRRARGA